MRRSDINPLIRLLIVNLLGGSALGAAFASFFLALNFVNLRTLVFSDSDRAIALLLLFAGLAMTYATAAIAGAVMLNASIDGGDMPSRD